MYYNIIILSCNIYWLGNGTDYDSTSFTTVLAAGATHTRFNISVTKDYISEQSEVFEVKFNILSSPRSTVVLQNGSIAVCTIIDNTSKWFITIWIVS